MASLAKQSAAFRHAGQSAEVLAREVEHLKLRLAAEQQCVLREQHITARMWIEKSHAEERAEAALARVAALEQQVQGWEAWMASEKRQKRLRLKALLGERGTSPRPLLDVLLQQLGIPALNLLKSEDREALAASLTAAAAEVRLGLAARPPGL